ncbi:hypothetical protein ACFE04_021935 [Oxalis oulophora]
MKFMKLGSKPDAFQAEENNIRSVTSELASDIIIVVGDTKFYLHKFPLLSKCARLQKSVVNTNQDNCDELDISDIPSGAATFEICAKFCYGMTVTLNAYNVIATRCAAEYLGMHETVEKGNLIYKIDVFLTSSIFRCWKDTVIVLQTTKSLLPFSEELKIVNQCIDSITNKACVDTSKVTWSYSYNRKKLSQEYSSDPNGIRIRQVPPDWWVEDLCEIEIDLFKRIIVNINSKETLSNEVIGEALQAYAYRRLPGFSKGVIQSRDVVKYRSTVDTIVWLLPEEKNSVSCGFLLKLLKAAILVDSGDTVKELIVKKIGHQLEEASVNDLLIKSSEVESIMYDVETVEKIIGEFLMRDQNGEIESLENDLDIQEMRKPGILSDASKLMVGKLIDGYLAEIAKDPNLPLETFMNLSEMVSGSSRPSHDGIYRAIDMYLTSHPGISKSERKGLCSTPDLPSSIKNLNNGSQGSMRSAATNPEDEWDAMATSEELKALRGELASLRISNGVRNSTDRRNSIDRAVVSKVKGLLNSKRMLTKLWSGKGVPVDNSGSDSPESLGSTSLEEGKSTPSKNRRFSVS